MAITADKIRDLLGTGLSNETVASTIGVHPSYISQLMSEESFYNEVIELRTKNLAAASVRDRGIDGLEDTLIKKLKDAVEHMYKPQDLLRAFAVINSAKRRGTTVEQGVVVNNQVVTLRLSKTIVNNFKTNDHGEVVEVEGRTLVTMPAASLVKDLIAKEAKENPELAKQYQKVQKYLPQAHAPSITEEGFASLEKQGDQQGNPVDVKDRGQTPGTIDLSRVHKRSWSHSKGAF